LFNSNQASFYLTFDHDIWVLPR